MAKFVGTIRRLGLEGGVWGFISQDGEQYHLVDAPENLRQDGLQVEIEGEIAKGATIAMVGSILRVHSFRKR